MSWKLVLANGEMDKIRRRFMSNQQKITDILEAVFLQIGDRFKAQGGPASPWRDKEIDDHRHILQGLGKRILSSFQTTANAESGNVSTSHIAAFYAQEGTIKKGGKLNDIRAKFRGAKTGMFVPLTDKANATRPVTPHGFRAKRRYDDTLVRGRLKKGRIVPADADFVYLPLVSIPQREILPTSVQEKDFLDRYAVKVIGDL